MHSNAEGAERTATVVFTATEAARQDEAGMETLAQLAEDFKQDRQDLSLLAAMAAQVKPLATRVLLRRVVERREKLEAWINSATGTTLLSVEYRAEAPPLVREDALAGFHSRSPRRRAYRAGDTLRGIVACQSSGTPDGSTNQ